MIALDFEKPVAELETRIAELRATLPDAPEIARLEARAQKMRTEIYARLTPWQKTQVARHPDRPHFSDYAPLIFEDFTPLAGDRRFGEDLAMLGGPARLRGRAVMLIGHEKGHGTTERVRHNFGMAKPEGYRKAARLIELADRLGLPVVTLVDTPGAFPGIEAEERGQAEAIARATEACLAARVPIVAAITGEGGSGGAVAIATANRVLMLEHAVYSVISPEGCASILWRTGDRARDAAEALKLTAPDLKALGVADVVIAEPPGGAHRDHGATAQRLGDALVRELAGLAGRSPVALRDERRAKFMRMGA